MNISIFFASFMSDLDKNGYVKKWHGAAIDTATSDLES